MAKVTKKEEELRATSEENKRLINEEFGFDARLLEEAVEFSSPKASKRSSEIDDSEPLVNRIVKALSENPKGLKSNRIAELVGVSKKEVNKTLYANNELFEIDFFTWRLK